MRWFDRDWALGVTADMSKALRGLLDNPDFRSALAWRRGLFKAGVAIIREGQQADAVHVILQGKVRVLGTVELDGDKKMRPGLSDLGEGEVFGELCLFDHQPRSASVVALTDCELAVIERDALLAFLDAHPEVGYAVLKELVQSLVDRLRQGNRRVSALMAWGLKAHHMDNVL